MGDFKQLKKLVISVYKAKVLDDLHSTYQTSAIKI